jgi:hypothetical protein
MPCTLEWVLVGLCANASSSLKVLPGSILAASDGLDFVVAAEVLDAFSDSLLDKVALEAFESREGGRASGKEAVEGDCSLDEGTETTTGDDTAVPPGLRVAGPILVTTLFVPAAPPSAPSLVCSLTPPTDALMRLYRPLRPPCTSSMPFGSSSAGAGGAVRSSKVVRVSVRDAVACFWWSASCSDARAVLAMAAVWGMGCVYVPSSAQ